MQPYVLLSLHDTDGEGAPVRDADGQLPSVQRLESGLALTLTPNPNPNPNPNSNPNPNQYRARGPGQGRVGG